MSAACDRGAGEGGQVGGDVQEGARGRSGSRGSARASTRGATRFDGDAAERDGQHDPAVHVEREIEPPDRAVDDQDADDQQRDAVHLRGEDLEPAEAERPAPPRRARRETRGAESAARARPRR